MHETAEENGKRYKTCHIYMMKIPFEQRDEKVCFFTGLTNWETLFKLCKFVEHHLVGHVVLTAFQQLMLTLIWLIRLASSGQGLGYQFCIHSSTVSRILGSVVCMVKLLDHVAREGSNEKNYAS